MLPISGDQVECTFGYHPLIEDLAEFVATTQPELLLVCGRVLDCIDAVDETRSSGEDVRLPVGIYWFGNEGRTSVMAVAGGLPPADPQSLDTSQIDAEHPLALALGWFQHLWPTAVKVPTPLFRVRDEVVVLRDDQDAAVKQRRYLGAAWQYQVLVEGQLKWLAEQNLAPRPDLGDPTAWVQSRPDSAEDFAATLTRAKLDQSFTDTVFSFRATRTVFRPYQFKPVMKLLASGSLRMLVADEVGLGKTIEAGLLWTELEARRRANRVLVVCPSGLVPKWQREMADRFDFELEELTNPGLATLHERLQSGRAGVRTAYICSLERLRRWEQLEDVTRLGLEFDLVIVDEAHAFRNAGTKSNALGGVLSQWADALVFLSATPLNLHNRDLYNLLELLVPGEFGDAQALEERLVPNGALHAVVESLVDSAVTSRERLVMLSRIAETPFGLALRGRPEYAMLQGLLERDPMSPRDVSQARRLAAELHGLSAAVTRTRKVDVNEDKPLREPHRIVVDWTQSERAFYEAFFDWCVERARAARSPVGFAMQMPLRLAGSCLPMAARQVLGWGQSATVDTTGDSGTDESEVPPSRLVPPGEELLRLASTLRGDTKCDRFEAALRDIVQQGKQVLVFTFSRSVVDYLHHRLAPNFRVAVLHGDIGKEARQQVMADFRNGHYELLLATRVASEGLDFEFCSAVVNYDLPWNPMEVEQRIGRIDRIGQTERKIIVHNLHTPDTIEATIIERLLERIGVFERSIGGLEPIIESRLTDITGAISDFRLSAAQQELRAAEISAAIEEQAQSVEDVERASAYLLSSDGVDIDGLERDLVRSGRYVGQRELAHLVRHWSATISGGQVRTDGDVLTLVGNAALATDVQRIVAAKDRGRHEVADLLRDLRNETRIHLSLDPERARTSGLSLLTATHPLVRAAVTVPGHRQSRFASLSVSEPTLRSGLYLVVMAIARWSGIRPTNEVWSSAIDLATGRPAPEEIGQSVHARLAEGELLNGPSIEDLDLVTAATVAEDSLLQRQVDEEILRLRENEALAATRRLSIEQVSWRKQNSLAERIATLRHRDKERIVPLFEAQLHRETERLRDALADLERQSRADMSLEFLAACVVEVTE